LVIKAEVSLKPSKPETYPVFIGSGASRELTPNLMKVYPGRKAVIISDITVWDLHGSTLAGLIEEAGLPYDTILVPPGEQEKNLDSAAILYDALAECGSGRRDPIIAFGGGVVGDLAGFVASTYMRGVPFINIPTTLLAMADSSIGGKTGVDLDQGKNLVGTVYQPSLVISDIDFLNTLPDEEYACGKAELIKTAFIGGGDLLVDVMAGGFDGAVIEQQRLPGILDQAVRFKAGVVSEDPSDKTGRRAILNYGHTFAHAVEAASSYEGSSHGAAVAIGMVFAARLGEKLGISEPGLAKETEKVLESAGLPVSSSGYAADELIAIMRSDKKNQDDGVTFILLEKFGSPVIRSVDTAVIAEFVKECV
jgi:3-dehydroquinate synthase